jgi:hypothetical protein
MVLAPHLIEALRSEPAIKGVVLRVVSGRLVAQHGTAWIRLGMGWGRLFGHEARAYGTPVTVRPVRRAWPGAARCSVRWPG